MFGIGFAELVLVLAAALIFIGPDKLPELAKSLARALNEFRRAGDEIKSVITDSTAPSGKNEAGKSYAAKGEPPRPRADEDGRGAQKESGSDGPEGGMPAKSQTIP